MRKRYEEHHNAAISDEAVLAAARLSDRYLPGRYLPDKAIDLIDEAAARARIAVMNRPPRLKKMEDEIRKISRRKELAVKNQIFERAATLRDQEKKQQEKLDRELEKWKEGNSKMKVRVGREGVAGVLARWTGIPVHRIEEGETFVQIDIR